MNEFGHAIHKNSPMDMEAVKVKSSDRVQRLAIR